MKKNATILPLIFTLDRYSTGKFNFHYAVVISEADQICLQLRPDDKKKGERGSTRNLSSSSGVSTRTVAELLRADPIT